MSRRMLAPLLSLTLLGGCQTGPPEIAQQRADCGERFRNAALSGPKGTPVQLVGCVLAETVARGEEIRILVAVLNETDAPLQARVRLDLLDALAVTVVAPGGDTLQLPFAWEPYDLSPELVTFALPRGGMAGRVINLSCGHADYHFADRRQKCKQLYSFDRAGEYIITIEHSDAWACASNPCNPGDAWSGVLRAEPIVVRVRDR